MRLRGYCEDRMPQRVLDGVDVYFLMTDSD